MWDRMRSTLFEFRPLLFILLLGILSYGFLMYRSIPMLAPTDEFKVTINHISLITGLNFPSGRVLRARHRKAGLVGSSGLWAILVMPASDLIHLREKTCEITDPVGSERDPDWSAVFREEEVSPLFLEGIRTLRKPAVFRKGDPFAPEGKTMLFWDAYGAEQRRVYLVWWSN